MIFLDSDASAKLPRCDSENTQLKEAITAVEQQAGTSASSLSAKVDPVLLQELQLPSGARVVGDWACMLNQTDVINNNNKFYVIQIVESAKQFHLFTRWGRVVSLCNTPQFVTVYFYINIMYIFVEMQVVIHYFLLLIYSIKNQNKHFHNFLINFCDALEQGETGQKNIDSYNSIEDASQGFCKKFSDKTGNKWDNRSNFVAKNKKYTLLAIGDNNFNDYCHVRKCAYIYIKKRIFL